MNQINIQYYKTAFAEFILGANAISIIIPCHRVIGKDGTLTGYAGGISLKKKLLELEKQALV